MALMTSLRASVGDITMNFQGSAQEATVSDVLSHPAFPTLSCLHSQRLVPGVSLISPAVYFSRLLTYLSALQGHQLTALFTVFAWYWCSLNAWWFEIRGWCPVVPGSGFADYFGYYWSHTKFVFSSLIPNLEWETEAVHWVSNKWEFSKRNMASSSALRGF